MTRTPTHRTPGLRALGALLLGTAVNAAHAAPVALRAALDGPGAPTVRATVDLDGPGGPRTVILPEGGTVIDLPPGPVTVRSRDRGVDVGTRTFTVTPQGADVTVVVVPDVAVTVTLPAQAAPGDTVTARVALHNRSALPLTLSPELTLSPDLLLLRRAGLTRTVAPDATVTVDVPLLVGGTGDLDVGVNVRGLPGRAHATLRGRAPARATVTVVPAGEDGGRPTLSVRNAGDVDGTFPVLVRAQGATDARVLHGGAPVSSGTLRVPAGETVTVQVEGTPVAAPARVTVSVAGTPATVPLDVPAAPLHATLDVTPADPLPGETVTATLHVDNRGPGPVTGPLDVRAPAWLALRGPRGDVTLPAGTSVVSWTATVPFGPADRGEVRVTGGGALAAVQDARPLTRTLLTVRTGVDADTPPVGSDALLPVYVANPVDRAVTVQLAAVGADGGPPVTVDVGALGRATTTVSVRTARAGDTPVTVAASVDGVAAAVPQAARVTAAAAPRTERRSTLRLPLRVQGLTTGTLLAAHLPPDGARFVAGSAAVRTAQGRAPLPDPRTGDDGRLYWTLPPDVYEGTLEYDVAHSGPLDDADGLALTARVGERDLMLAGTLGSAAWLRATPVRATESDTLIRFPRDGTVLPEGGRTDVILEGPADVPVSLTVNGESIPESRVGEAGRAFDRERRVYVGLPMRVGANTVEVRYGTLTDRVQVFVPGATAQVQLELEDGTVADGARPVVLLVRGVDEGGRPAGQGRVTLHTSLEPLDPDADPATPGYQAVMQGGVARVRLEAVTSAQTVEVEALLGALRARSALFVPVPHHVAASYQVSAGVTYSARAGVRGTLVARGYGEFPLGGGQMQVAADTAALPALTSAATPDRRYPVTGSGNESRTALSSDVGLAFRYERRELSVGYHDGPLTLPTPGILPGGSALRVTANDGPVTLYAVAARLPGGTVTDTFVPDGRRTFTLSVPATAGSERVVLRGTQDVALVAGRDYALDAVTGDLTLTRTPSVYGPDFEVQTLVVTYVPDGEQRTQLGAAVGAAYRRGAWTVGGTVGAVGDTLTYGVQGRYQRDGVEIGAAYHRGPDSPDGRMSVGGSFHAGRVSGSVSAGGTGDLARTVTGTAELAYRPGPFGVKLGARMQGGTVWTAVLGEYRAPGGVTVSAGPELRWASATAGRAVNAVVGASVTRGNLTADVTHAQPLAGGDDPLTRFGVSYALSATTTVTGRVQRSGPGGVLSGELGAQQKLGTSNLNVTYQLPGASGQGSRARFGVNTPITFSRALSATVHASLLRDLDRGVNTAGAGFTVTYRRETLTGTLGMDATSSVDATRVTVRGGVTGTLGAHVLSADGSVQVLPAVQGHVNVSHAWRDDRTTVLQYHRFTTVAGDPTVEGEAALDVSVPPAAGRVGLDLRPSVAYQVPLARREDTTVQAGLGVGVPITDRFGVGVSGYVIAQPGRSQYAATLGADVRYRVNDHVRLVAGYSATVAGMDLAGLTPGAGGGVFVRADVFGGR